MRVTIATRIFSPEPSAASYMLEAIARAFGDEGHDVTVLTTRAPAHLVPTPIPGVRVSRAPVLRDASGYVRGYLPYLSFDIPLAFRLLFRRRADLYLVEPPPTTGAVVRVVLALLRRPYVYDAADVWSDAARMATSSKAVLGALRAAELFALRGAAHLFTVSEGVSARMRELEVSTPSTVIGFGVDDRVFHYSEPSGDAPAYFVYAGTYSEWHGAGILLEAFRDYVADHPGHRLLFVGNGTERPELERRCAEWGLDGVEFRDFVDGRTLNGILAGATASLATLKPGQGYDYAFTTKVYSSLAAGCPVVFAGVGPTVDFIAAESREHPVGVAVAYDAGAIRAALEAALEHGLQPEERRELSEWARARFSLRSIASRVVSVSAELTR